MPIPNRQSPGSELAPVVPDLPAVAGSLTILPSPHPQLDETRIADAGGAVDDGESSPSVLKAADHIIGVGLGGAGGLAVGAVIGAVAGPAGIASGAIAGA